MTIDISNKDIKKLRRLGNAINQNMVPVDDVKDLVATIWQKVQQSSASETIKQRTPKKEDRKDHYRNKLRRA